MNKTKVAVAMGGYSSEFEISVQSGTEVCAHLSSEIFDVYPIHITKEGWFYVAANGMRSMVNKDNFSFVIDSKTVTPDVVFNTVHGTPGEDGYLASYFELIGIPQTSAGFYQAAISFNKRDCLTVLNNFGIQCATSYYINKGRTYDIKEIVANVGLPCFVKPNRAGSSFGVSKVHSIEEMPKAISEAFKEDHEVIIETALVGTEVSVGVFERNTELIAFAATEIVSENDFFDYEAKYLGKSQEITPARISEIEMTAVQTQAKKIYQLLNMKGITRTDFIIQDGIPYLIETNTTPGLSKESIIPKQVRHSGMSLADFFAILVQEAIQ
jgi:D-alanine-D-alanine ligase